MRQVYSTIVPMAIWGSRSDAKASLAYGDSGITLASVDPSSGFSKAIQLREVFEGGRQRRKEKTIDGSIFVALCIQH